MDLEIKKLIFDLDQAIGSIEAFTHGLQFSDYESNLILRSAVERQFEILGEALNRLKKSEPKLVARFTEYQRIIGFRNLLIHGYDVVSDAIVWDIIQNKLPILRQELENIKFDFGIE